MEIYAESYACSCTPDFHFKFRIRICEELVCNTVSYDEPFDIEPFASKLANFDATSSEVVLDLATPDNGLMEFRITINPHKSFGMAKVCAHQLHVCHDRGTDTISEHNETMLEIVPIETIQEIGKGLLAASRDIFYTFESAPGDSV